MTDITLIRRIKINWLFLTTVFYKVHLGSSVYASIPNKIRFQFPVHEVTIIGPMYYLH